MTGFPRSITCGVCLQRDVRAMSRKGVALMRLLPVSAVLLLVGVSQAFASVAPSPEADLGLASLAMVAAAAFLAYRLRRR
jgi:hypothetical protein